MGFHGTVGPNLSRKVIYGVVRGKSDPFIHKQMFERLTLSNVLRVS